MSRLTRLALATVADTLAAIDPTPGRTAITGPSE
jgi:hypothetical protein